MRSAFLFLLVVSTVAGIAIPIRLAQVPAGPSTPSPPPPTTPKGPVLEHPEVVSIPPVHTKLFLALLYAQCLGNYSYCRNSWNQVQCDHWHHFLLLVDSRQDLHYWGMHRKAYVRRVRSTGGCTNNWYSTASSTYQSTFNTFKVTTMFGAVDGILGIDTVTVCSKYTSCIH